MPDHHTQAGAGCPPNAVAAAPVSVPSRESNPNDTDPAILAADGRTQVIERQRDADRDAAPLHETPPERADELRQIARTTPAGVDRVRRAVRTGWTTCEDLQRFSDVLAPHSRLADLRREGVEFECMAVRTIGATGRVRNVLAYRIGGAA